MKIYFDRNKNACDYRPADCIAEVEETVWSTYSGTELGSGWDIINGEFVPFITPKEVERPILYEQRKLERESVYERTEVRLSQLEEQHVNGDISDQEYTACRKEIMAYRKSVRSTVEQPDYPFRVAYPRSPESDISVKMIATSKYENPGTADEVGENTDHNVNEVNNSKSEPWI